MRFGASIAVLLVTAACSETVTTGHAGTPDESVDSSTVSPGACTQVPGIFKGGSYASSIVTDEQSVYWADSTVGGLVKAPLGGGSPTKLATIDLTQGPVCPTVNSTDVFWVNYTGFHRVPIAGGALDIAPVHGNWGLFVDDGRAFYTMQEATSDGGASQTALVEQTLATKSTRRIAEERWALSLVAVGSDIFGVTCNSDGLWRVSGVDGSVTTLVADTFCPLQVVAADGSLYYSDSSQESRQSFKRFRCDGAAPETLASFDGFFQFALSSAFAYLLVHGTSGDDSVLRLPLEGGDPVEIAKAKNAVNGIEATGDAVYWLENSSGSYVVKSVAQ